ncbi:hypothetical protein ILUMI_21463 [Ignelater luminosus]|uniref:Uncharacterized protein n=1 Tax=Ignelater luminosus TaxID=2038154 RepID=A0A8K0CIS7_IGNLU|nr:hypothetical protein ILUMI_21463 [Ignelater luminosus]
MANSKPLFMLLLAEKEYIKDHLLLYTTMSPFIAACTQRFEHALKYKEMPNIAREQPGLICYCNLPFFTSLNKKLCNSTLSKGLKNLNISTHQHVQDVQFIA